MNTFRLYLFLLVLSFFVPVTSQAQIAELPWLTEAQTPPSGEFNITPLKHWQANLDQVITNRRQWQRRSSLGGKSPRETIKQRWLDYLGPLAQSKRTLPKLELLKSEEVEAGDGEPKAARAPLTKQQTEAAPRRSHHRSGPCRRRRSDRRRSP